MEFNLKHTKHFRYEAIKNNANQKHVIYALHGYGQLARYFIQKFENLPDDIMIIAPEGMHRFYVKGTSGRIGASWMTKEARELDIDDNISWLDALDAKISSEYPIIKRTVLGFSQGGSTALRWNLHGNCKIDNLIIWAADFPSEELVRDRIHENKGDNYFVLGNQDEIIREDRGKELCEFYKDAGFKLSKYIGSHDIDQQTLTNIIEEIKQK